MRDGMMRDGLQELSQSEIEEVSGGFVPVVLWVLGVAAGAIVAEAAVGFADGLIEGFNNGK